MKTIKSFYEQSYLEANPDVKEAIKKGWFKSGLEHLEKFGLEEIRKGDRKFHPEYEPFNEEKYLELFPDIKAAVEKGEFKSAFEHFCLFGYKEILDEVRDWPKIEKAIEAIESIDKIESIESIEEIDRNFSVSAINGFDEQSYLEVNSDVKEAVEKGWFKSGLEHLEKFGLEEIRKGDRKFHPEYEPFNEEKYLELFPDIKEAVEKGEFKSAFEHFCLFGYKEIIDEVREWPKFKEINIVNKKEDTNNKALIIKGKIGEYEKGKIRGWFYTTTEEYSPFVMIDNVPCKIIKTGISMPRVSKKENLPTDKIGFIAEPLDDIKNKKVINLYAVNNFKCKKIYSNNRFEVNRVDPESFKMIKKLKEISSKKDSVAIVIWEATHNPLGRAKVLYDILKENGRPVIIIGFNFGFGKDKVWTPLLTSDVDMITLNWNEKGLYKKLFDKLEIRFETVWICKPRLPGYVLADMISYDKTKFILDIDDNESALSTSEASQLRPYGVLGDSISQQITCRIKAKSVASISIKEKWGGELVRHARKSRKNFKPRKFLPEKVSVGFFGTVRPHKNLQRVAKEIKSLRDENINIEFIVGGNFIPIELKEEIESFGAITKGHIEYSKLYNELEKIDVVITGFIEKENQITKYQISSKIGDALSIGRPVLVPEGSSVKDLKNIKGIFLFNENNFKEKLLEAINFKEDLSLPDIFSIYSNYEQFQKLEKIAFQQKKNDIFKEPLFSYSRDNGDNNKVKKTIVLIWKQPDSFIYGRRVDQIARSYKKMFPNDRVIILEYIEQNLKKNYFNGRHNFVGDEAIILERIEQKKFNLIYNGIEHIIIDNNVDIKHFFLSQNIYPTNSLLILFPIIHFFEKATNILSGYKIIVDVVDNQLFWSSSNPKRLVMQYKSMFEMSEKIVFNSLENRNYFITNGYISNSNEDKISVIPNWYEPLFYKRDKKIKDRDKMFKIIYSGNMNDRIDWDLLEKLLISLPSNALIYLIGNAKASVEKLIRLVNKYKNCIYLGPLDEEKLVNFLLTCDLAIMPHKVENISKYMNPLKVHMYAAYGLQCVSTNIPGLEKRMDNIIIADNNDEFINLCIEKIKHGSSRKSINLDFIYKETRDKYLNLIKTLLNS